MTGNGTSVGNRSFFARRPHFVPAIIAAVMLFGALGEWPYGYYQLLRWVVCAAAVFIAYFGWQWKRIWAVWLLGVLAVLFNPIVTIHLNREIWQVIDVMSGFMFIVSTFAIWSPIHMDENQKEPN